jgi:predicted deacylase
MLHGHEWFSVLVIRAVLSRLAPQDLAGNVVAVSVANPSALLTGSRCVLDDSDEPDLNRAFNGTYEWTSNQLARAIERHLFPPAHALIDYHAGTWGSTMAAVSFAIDHTDRSVSERSRGMALAAGFPVVHEVALFAGQRSLRTSLGCAGERHHVPGIVLEIGGLGFGEPQENAWVQANVESTIGVMSYLRMIDGPARFLDRYLFIRDYWRVAPRAGGYLEALIGLDRQFTDVEKGELLARVVDPATFEIVDEVRTPGHGVLFYSCRSHMVRPGAWAFGVANLEAGKAHWIDHRRAAAGLWRADRLAVE